MPAVRVRARTAPERGGGSTTRGASFRADPAGSTAWSSSAPPKPPMFRAP